MLFAKNYHLIFPSIKTFLLKNCINKVIQAHNSTHNILIIRILCEFREEKMFLMSSVPFAEARSKYVVDWVFFFQTYLIFVFEWFSSFVCVFVIEFSSYIQNMKYPLVYGTEPGSTFIWRIYANHLWLEWWDLVKNENHLILLH